MRWLILIVVVSAGSSVAAACGREMVCGNEELGISKGCCDNEGKLFVHFSGRAICVTRTRADLVLRLFRADVLVLCGVVLLCGVSLFATGESSFPPCPSVEKVPDV